MPWARGFEERRTEIASLEFALSIPDTNSGAWHDFMLANNMYVGTTREEIREYLMHAQDALAWADRDDVYRCHDGVTNTGTLIARTIEACKASLWHDLARAANQATDYGRTVTAVGEWTSGFQATPYLISYTLN